MRSLGKWIRGSFSGLRWRLLLLLVLVCAPLVLLTLHTAGEQRRRATASFQQRSQRIVQLAGREETAMVEQTRKLLQAIAEAGPARSLNRRGSKRLLDQLSASAPRYASLGVVRTNAQLLANAGPAPQSSSQVPDLALNQSRCPVWLDRIFQNRAFTIGQMATGVGGRPAFVLGIPVFGREGQLQGAAFALLAWPWLIGAGSELPAQLPRGAAWTELAVDGTVLARLPEPEDAPAASSAESSFAKIPFTGQKGVVEALDPSGVPAIFAFAHGRSQLTRGDVLSVLSIPRNVLFAEADRMVTRNLTWLAAAAGLALALGLLGGHFLIVRPLKALAFFSARLAAGDLVARNGLSHSRDELGQLSRALEKMALRLEQRELEGIRDGRKLKFLSHRLVEVQEAERRYIARELHDEIGQSLTVAEMNLQAALESPGASTLTRRLQASIQAIERVVAQVRDLSLNLRPAMLDDLGLEPALRWYIHRQAALAGLQTQLRIDVLEDRMDPIIETECFRVAQEALTNIVRHAHAQAVVVELARRDSHLHLSVRDDGVGFDVTPVRQRAANGASLGLLSMEERASLAGGGLELRSAPGQGTEIHAWFPIKWRTLHA